MSDLYSPVDGEVIEVNEELDDDPGLINAEPYGLGWMFRVRVADGQRRSDRAALPHRVRRADHDRLAMLRSGAATSAPRGRRLLTVTCGACARSGSR